MVHNMKNQLIHIIITTVVCVFGAQAFGQTPDNTVKIIQKTQVEHSPTIVPKNKLVANVDNPSSYAAYSQNAQAKPVANISQVQVRSENPKEQSSLKITKTQNDEAIKPIKNTKNEVTISPSKNKINGYPKIKPKSNKF